MGTSFINLKTLNHEERRIKQHFAQLVSCRKYCNRTIEQMKDIRKELNRFVKPVQIEIIKSDFETVSFRELR